jgi:hypothetical protein
MEQPSLGRSPAQRLAELDLDIETIHFALRAADAERRTCTPFDPPVLGPWLQWAKTIGAIREQLVPRGWTMDNSANVPRTVHPSDRFAMVVNTGDSGTGDLRRPVSTKYPRGLASQQAIHANRQLVLFGNTFNDNGQREGSERETWLLLIRFVDDQVRAEISLPAEVTEEGSITLWNERIPIPPLPLDPIEGINNPPDDGPDFDISVVPR